MTDRELDLWNIRRVIEAAPLCKSIGEMHQLFLGMPVGTVRDLVGNGLARLIDKGARS